MWSDSNPLVFSATFAACRVAAIRLSRQNAEPFGSKLGSKIRMTPEGIMVKEPLPGSVALLEKVQARLGPNRLPLLIAIDGPDGVGKSMLTYWLAWQVGAPSVHLDLYLNRDSKPLSWKVAELRRIVGTRVGGGQPVVVEGVMILDALTAIGRKADFLVYLDGEGGYTLSERLADYRARHQPEQRADVRMQGFAE